MRWPLGTTMQVGQISTSSSYTSPGASGCASSCVWCGRSGDLGLRLERRGEERDAVAQGGIRHLPLPDRWLGAEPEAFRVQMELRPARAPDRPLALPTLLELLARPPDLEQHPGLVPEARVLALEKMPEEALLQADAVVGVEVRPVLARVHLEPYLFLRGAHEPLEVAAGTQALAAPVGGGQKRHLHLGEVGKARAPVLVACEGVVAAVLVEVAARRGDLHL